MNDQHRTEMAADNCEVLRARLARYEDAEGVPNGKAGGVVLPEPIKRGDEGGSGEYGAAMIRGYNACLREVARLNPAPSHGEQVREVVNQCAETCERAKLCSTCAGGLEFPGLPDPGSIAEARIPHHTSDGRQMLWTEVEVIAHKIIQGAIYSWVKDPGNDGGFYAPMMLSFRAAAPSAGSQEQGE